MSEFEEDDQQATKMAYNETSRVPWWWVSVWVTFLAGFVIYYLVYLVPDLKDWGWPR